MNILSPRVLPLFAKTRTICFGRFLMQVPATATIVYGPSEVETTIEYLEGQGGRIAEHVTSRLSEVEEERKFLLKSDIPNLPLFGKVIDGVIAGQKIVFGSKDRVGYTVYSFIPLGNDLFVQSVESLPEEDIVATINGVARRLRPRLENEVPAEPGMCIEGGFAPVQAEYERATVGVRLTEFPDVHFSVDVHKNLKYLAEGSSLKELREQAKQMAEADGLGAVFARTKILRERDLQLGTWKGEEQALRTPAYKDDMESHDFRFHSMGAVHDPLQPQLTIQFDSGVKENSKAKVKPSITDEEALAIWDRLITSIRVRQPSDATPAPRVRVPVATAIPTGAICPETGWWQCTESKKKAAGSRQIIKAGERMPHAAQFGASGLWAKLTSSRARQIETVWKLIDYVDDGPTPPEENAGIQSDMPPNVA